MKGGSTVTVRRFPKLRDVLSHPPRPLLQPIMSTQFLDFGLSLSAELTHL